jgi:Ser/Thr protein kinase RdoA (MazF antagonist)
MSSISLVRPPSWPGASPGLPQPVPLEPDAAAAIRAAFGLEGAVFALRHGGASLPLFRLEPPDGPPLFLKLVEPSRRAAAERAEAVARDLAAAGLAVPAAIAGFPRTLADGRLAVALPWVDGRRLRAEPDDLAALGRAVGALHRALAVHPDRHAWQAATDRRLAELAAVRADLAAGRLEAGPDPAALRRLAADPALDFAPAGLPRTPLHGDLNPGNVLVDPAGAVVLLDFEDVFHSVLPPRFELVLLIERHILLPVADDGAAAALIRALLAGYAAGGGPDGLLPVERPADVLRSLALRALCVLALGARSGLDGGASEWGKFLFLEERARARAGLLERLLAGG